MNEQEKDVIGGIFDRLRQADGQPRDPEAEAFIRERVAAQPSAPYVMAQVVHVQEQALANLNQRIAALEAELAEARNAPQAQQAGGFLSGLFGGGAPAAPARPSAAPVAPEAAARGGASSMGADFQGAQPPSGPWGGANAPGFGAGANGPWGQRMGGGGFLSSALTTAAGVAGGLVAGNLLASAFGLGSHGQTGTSDTASAASTPQADPASATDTKDDSPQVQEANYDESDSGDDDYDAGYDNGGDTSDWL
ncbi:MAG: DUF2076 domain-containing protein [Chelatococcus sp.]|jgi:hypothetical protein|uniref:DUF2076 domain-containing protein n=1 Tax=Chelatococcus sp. TaxID=1953771 RepID=UPI0025C58E02|nr:DUF2076 domain-containing protein [Chelatococcus sp.]MBX3537603.1 DUF2076 domain-containing protein [Chelatococcus sp.]